LRTPSLRERKLIDQHEPATGRTACLLLMQRQHHPLSSAERRHGPNLVFVSAGPGNGLHMLFAPGGLVQSVIMHVPLVSGPDVLEQTHEELFRREGKGLVHSILVVLLSERDILSLIAYDALLGKRGAAGVPTAVGPRLLAGGIGAHPVDIQAARVLAKQTPNPLLGRSVALEPAPQQSEQRISPEPSVLLSGEDLERLPDAIGSEPSRGAEDVPMDMKAQIPSIGMHRGHHSGNRRMLATAGTNRVHGGHDRCPRDYRQEVPALVEQCAQLPGHRERQMPVGDVEKPPLCLGGCLLGARSAAGRAEAALAGEADGMGAPAGDTSIAGIAHCLGPADQRFLDRPLCRTGDQRRQTSENMPAQLGPMLRKDAMEDAPRCFAHTTKYAPFALLTLKTALSFLRSY
jgi:hypothetical protein